MLKKILHNIVSIPFVYEQAQIFFGAHKRKKVVEDLKLSLQKDSCVLDLGGGTGFYRDLWSKDCRYICLDIDLTKLKGLTKSGPDDFLLLADAGKIPLKDNSIDIIFCNSMSHHITEELLERLLAESARILKNSGKLLFLDAILKKESLLNCLLWKLDRGEYPHTKVVLTSLIERHFIIDQFQEFSHFYDFNFFVCKGKV